MTKLSVNVNKIATLRNTRTNGIPDLVRLSRIALAAGAHGLTVHPRPDQRHIRPEDVGNLAALVAEFSPAEYNIEGNPFEGLLEHCRRVRPAQTTLVPDARDALTSNHGWPLATMTAEALRALEACISELHSFGGRVSLFLDPIPALVPLAKKLGADRIELYTEPYADAAAKGRAEIELPRYAATAAAAAGHGLGVNAGHDLSLTNLAQFFSAVSPVAEVSIGHALIADALELGLGETVRRYLEICKGTKG